MLVEEDDDSILLPLIEDTRIRGDATSRRDAFLGVDYDSHGLLLLFVAAAARELVDARNEKTDTANDTHNIAYHPPPLWADRPAVIGIRRAKQLAIVWDSVLAHALEQIGR